MEAELKKVLLIKKMFNLLNNKEFADSIIFSICEQFLIPLKEAVVKISIPDLLEQWYKSVGYAKKTEFPT